MLAPVYTNLKTRLPKQTTRHVFLTFDLFSMEDSSLGAALAEQSAHWMFLCCPGYIFASRKG